MRNHNSFFVFSLSTLLFSITVIQMIRSRFSDAENQLLLLAILATGTDWVLNAAV